MAVHPTPHSPPRPLVLLTRPRPASEGFAKAITGADICISPLMEIVGTGAEVPARGIKGLIVTSQNAVPYLPDIDVPAYCVGPGTAAAVGARAEVMGPDAEGLLSALITRAPEGPLLHCHGTHLRGDIVGRLNAKGIKAKGVAVYAQRDSAPTAEFHEALGHGALIVPLFSPRSARLFAKAAGDLPSGAQIIAISQAAADALPRDWPVQVVARPDGPHMSNAVQSAVARRNCP